ncbi:hypothetical protein D8S78_06485 [Natrialba swarupiae]|nr:hypothetical protein [Natrialba swarupiae]
MIAGHSDDLLGPRVDASDVSDRILQSFRGDLENVADLCFGRAVEICRRILYRRERGRGVCDLLVDVADFGVFLIRGDDSPDPLNDEISVFFEISRTDVVGFPVVTTSRATDSSPGPIRTTNGRSGNCSFSSTIAAWSSQQREWP